MRSARLDGTWRGWLWMIGWCLIAFGGLLWSVIAFLAGEVVGLFTVIGPALVAAGLFALLVRAGTFPRSR